MNDVEKKLANYRAQKEREAKYNDIKETFKNKLSPYFVNGKSKISEVKERLLKSEDEDTEAINDNISEIDSLSSEDDQIKLNCCTYVDFLFYLLCFFLWGTLYIIFIKLQFGTVYLIVTSLIGIYLNTRTGPNKDYIQDLNRKGRLVPTLFLTKTVRV